MNLYDDNHFTFTCPVFNVDTKLSVCLKLRDLVWRGDRPTVRKGCQACMSGGKCPAATILQQPLVEGVYHSATPVKGKLGLPVLERIRHTMVMQSTLDQYGVPTAERALIANSGERIDAQIAVAPKTEKQARQLVQSAARRNAPEPTGTPRTKQQKPKAAPTPNLAAQTGDLSAAISKGHAA